MPWTLRPRRLGKDAFERPRTPGEVTARADASMPEVGEGGEAFDEGWVSLMVPRGERRP